MANTITSIIPTIIARGLLELRSRAMMTRLVNLDYSTDAAKKGDTITIPLPHARTASSVTPAAVPSSAEATVSSTVTIPLDNWEKANFELSDNDVNRIMQEERESS